jgi:Zn-finger nucleic acid-binding protein
MMPGRLEIKKHLFGQHTVSYDCPHCGAGLSSPISDAGKADYCPDCRMQFVVPGQKEAIRIQEEQQLAAQKAQADAEKRREQAAQRAAFEQQTRRLEQHKKETERTASRQAELDRQRADEDIRELQLIGQPSQTRRCPFCAEEILAAARKCKHCGEFLDGRRRAMHAAPAQPVPVYVRSGGQGGCGLIVIIALGIVLGVLFLAFL